MYIGTDKPTIKLFNQYIRMRVAPHWRELGVQLLENEYVEKLNVIEKNHPNDVERCCSEMFNYWLQVDPCASWNKLIGAFEKIERNDLAAKVRKYIGEGILIN